MSRTTPLRSVATVSDSATNSNELCKAILDADIKKVEELIKNGIDVNEKSSDGYSPLCIAAFWGYADIAKMLLEAK
jgi:ankyrin repeat protein